MRPPCRFNASHQFHIFHQGNRGIAADIFKITPQYKNRLVSVRHARQTVLP